jgi:hypothetical protein
MIARIQKTQIQTHKHIHKFNTSKCKHINQRKDTTNTNNIQHKHYITKVLRDFRNSCESGKEDELAEIKERWEKNVQAFLRKDDGAPSTGTKLGHAKKLIRVAAGDLLRALCHCLAFVGAPLWRFTTGPWIQQRTLVLSMDEGTTGTAAVQYMINHLGLRQVILAMSLPCVQGPSYSVQCTGFSINNLSVNDIIIDRCTQSNVGMSPLIQSRTSGHKNRKNQAHWG